jgi:hypothetical protein
VRPRKGRGDCSDTSLRLGAVAPSCHGTERPVGSLTGCGRNERYERLAAQGVPLTKDTNALLCPHHQGCRHTLADRWRREAAIEILPQG